jgi:hypothetical protein
MKEKCLTSENSTDYAVLVNRRDLRAPHPDLPKTRLFTQRLDSRVGCSESSHRRKKFSRITAEPLHFSSKSLSLLRAVILKYSGRKQEYLGSQVPNQPVVSRNSRGRAEHLLAGRTLTKRRWICVGDDPTGFFLWGTCHGDRRDDSVAEPPCPHHFRTACPYRYSSAAPSQNRLDLPKPERRLCPPYLLERTVHRLMHTGWKGTDRDTPSGVKEITC